MRRMHVKIQVLDIFQLNMIGLDNQRMQALDQVNEESLMAEMVQVLVIIIHLRRHLHQLLVIQWAIKSQQRETT